MNTSSTVCQHGLRELELLRAQKTISGSLIRSPNHKQRKAALKNIFHELEKENPVLLSTVSEASNCLLKQRLCSLHKASLEQFQALCAAAKAGRMKVYLHHYVVVAAMIFCESISRITTAFAFAIHTDNVS